MGKKGRGRNYDEVRDLDTLQEVPTCELLVHFEWVLF